MGNSTYGPSRLLGGWMLEYRDWAEKMYNDRSFIKRMGNRWRALRADGLRGKVMRSLHAGPLGGAQRDIAPHGMARWAGSPRSPQTAHSPSPRMTWNGTLRFQSMNSFMVSSPNSTGIARSRTASSNAVVPMRLA